MIFTKKGIEQADRAEVLMDRYLLTYHQWICVAVACSVPHEEEEDTDLMRASVKYCCDVVEGMPEHRKGNLHLARVVAGTLERLWVPAPPRDLEPGFDYYGWLVNTLGTAEGFGNTDVFLEQIKYG